MAPRLGIPFVKMKRILVKPHLLIARHQVAYFHICDQNTADHVAACIQKNSTYPQSLFLESNPGTGLLTRSLINKGVPKIFLFAKKEKDMPEDLLDTVPKESISLHKKGLRNVIFSEHYNLTLQKTLTDEMKKLVRERLTTRMFLVYPTHDCKYFISDCASQLFNPLSFLSPIHTEKFFVISPVTYGEITATQKSSVADKYTKYSVILQTFLDISFVTKVKLSSICPAVPLKFYKKTTVKDEPNCAYLIKVVPKANINNLFGSVTLLGDYYFFVMQNMKTMSKFVIPELEKWVPGCGPTLIKNGYDIFLRFKDLTPQELVTLFTLFSSLEDYQSSVFAYAAENKSLRNVQDKEEEYEEPLDDLEAEI